MSTEPDAANESFNQRLVWLERIAHALAARELADGELRNLLMELAGKRERHEREALMSNAEAAAYAGMAVSTWRAYRKKAGIERANPEAARPKFRRCDIDEGMQRMSRR